MKKLPRLHLCILIALTIFAANACQPFRKGMAKTYYNSGAKKERNGDLAGAIAEFTKAISSDPQLIQAYTARAYAKARLKDYDGAFADYTEAIRQQPRLAFAYRARGMMKMVDRGDVDGALADFEKEIEIAPSLPAGYSDRAAAKERKNDLRGALHDVDRALQMDPNDQEATLVKCRIQWKQGDLIGAMHNIDDAIEADPKTPFLYRERAMTKMLAQDWAGMISDNVRFSEITQESRDYANLSMWVGRVHLGKLEEANQNLSAYLKSVPAERSHDWTSTIGKYLLDQISEEDLFKASANKDEMVDSGQKCEAWYYSGVKKLANGDKAAAAEHFHKCLDTKKSAFVEYDGATLELKLLGASS